MTLIDDLLPLLQCPGCGVSFDFRAVPTPKLARAECGVLSCRCAQYAVLDGIPILLSGRIGIFEHTTGATEVAGPTAAELVRLLVEGRGDEALVECLAPPCWPVWLQRLRRRLASPSEPKSLVHWWGKRQTMALLRNRSSIAARDVFGVFFSDETLSPDLGDYFIFRFAQPRHLAALALLSNLDEMDQPIVDFACGCGHLDHYLTCRPHPLRVIGVDLNFYHAWVARHWVAPRGHYICCNVAEGLPFRSGSVSATVVSDAYHYFPRREHFNREVERIAPGRIKILTRVGNRAIRPTEGAELSLHEYRAELGGANIRTFSECRLVRDYLARHDPLGSEPESENALEGSKWLSFVINPPAKPIVASARGGLSPHAVGHIGLNPIYAKSVVAGQTKLWFTFPRPWYAYENHQMLEYHARVATISATDIEALRSGNWNSTLEELLDQFVLIGLPERF